MSPVIEALLEAWALHARRAVDPQGQVPAVLPGGQPAPRPQAFGCGTYNRGLEAARHGGEGGRRLPLSGVWSAGGADASRLARRHLRDEFRHLSHADPQLTVDHLTVTCKPEHGSHHAPEAIPSRGEMTDRGSRGGPQPFIL
jgi:hypothetical protein